MRTWGLGVRRNPRIARNPARGAPPCVPTPPRGRGDFKGCGPRLGASGGARFRPPRVPTLHEDVGIARPRAGGELSASMRIGPLFAALRRMRIAFGGPPFYAHSRGVERGAPEGRVRGAREVDAFSVALFPRPLGMGQAGLRASASVPVRPGRRRGAGPRRARETRDR